VRTAVWLTLLCTLVPSAVRAQSVDEVVARHRGGCTTSGFEGLSEQLVRSHLCAFPGSVAEFAPYPGITLTSGRVHPLATSETVAALHAAADRSPLSVNSAFRTLVQQYALYHEGGCGLAAVPGNSNHQTGRAVDLGNYGAALSAMTGAGCVHPYPSSDPVHFDCPGPDMRAASVLVFQQLWNHNHPEDPIAEDGLYGPQTESRMGRSPAGGFGSDLCDVPEPEPEPEVAWGAELVGSSFEDPVVAAPGEPIVGTIELRNIGTEPWDENTRIGTTEPRDRTSALMGSDWLNPHRPAAVDGPVAPGETGVFTFTLVAPLDPGDYTESFGVVQESVAWFSDEGQLGPADGAITVRVMVAAEGSPPVLAEDGGSPPPPGVDGGTFVGGGPERPRGAGGGRAAPGPAPALPWLLVLAGLALLRARSRDHDL